VCREYREYREILAGENQGHLSGYIDANGGANSSRKPELQVSSTHTKTLEWPDL